MTRLYTFNNPHCPQLEEEKISYKNNNLQRKNCAC